MELGLSLGVASKPFSFIEKSHHEVHSSSDKRLGFCMGLSIGPSVSRDEDIGHEREEDDDHDEEKRTTTTTTNTEEAKKTSTVVDCETRSSVDPVFQLDLLPNTPVLRTPSSFLPFRYGSSEAGSSGQMARGVDVNKFPLIEEQEDGAALSSSPNNSAASSFQMDFCMYGNGGNKKDFENGDLGNEIETERASSRVSDEDENGCTRKKLRLSKEQSAFLEESFKEHNTLNPKQKLALAKQLNLRPRQVEVWFQNRRARTKLKQTEVDCEYLKRCCETLTEENRRLHKELQELRALKTSNPFYMQLPATTLTMCPSCERVATTNTNPAATTAAATTTSTATATSSPDPISKATGFSLSQPLVLSLFSEPKSSTSVRETFGEK